MIKKIVLSAVFLSTMIAQPSYSYPLQSHLGRIKITPKSKDMIAVGLVASLLGAYYTFKKPGSVAPVKSSDSLSNKIMYVLDSILGDMGEDRKIIRVDMVTGNVIYEKKEPRKLGWVLKTFSKKILPIIVASSIIFKTKDDVQKIVKSCYGEVTIVPVEVPVKAS